MSTNENSIFTKKQFVVLFALLAMFAWGCAYPFIKLGMIEWGIASHDAGGKMLFAGVRFTIAGLLTFIIAKGKGQPILEKQPENLGWLFLLGLVNTALHYFCFYTGLSNCEGGKASIINSFSPFLLMLLAFVIFREKMTRNKGIGIVLGIIGIIVVNFGTQLGGFAWNGEGMILLNCVCSAFGGILTRVVTKKVMPITATAYSLALGGLMLIAAGLVCGGRLNRVTGAGVLLLIGLIAISMVGFILYNQLITYNPITEIAMFNALIPVFGTLMSCLMLKEAFGIQNLFGLLFVGAGIYILQK